ncbi:MAG: tetratricopeptide repeat protein [Deltaproteobacteria bacterium]|nr:tetratricopeptide repeat protein [Deltaproteobacteria bacterium]
MKTLIKGILVFAIVSLAFIGFANADEKIAGLSNEAAEKKAIAHQTKGNAYDDDGKLNDAIIEYKESLKYSPDNVDTLFNLGTAYLKANKPQEAASTFEKVVKIDPNDFEAYNLLGIAYRGCGKYDDAKKSWEKSLAINPNQAKVKQMMNDKMSQK